MPGKLIIYSNFHSTLSLIENDLPHRYIHLVHNIHQFLYGKITKGWEITLQWISSDMGITGNEIVDRATSEITLGLGEHLQLEPSMAQNPLTRKINRTWDDDLSTHLQETALGAVRTTSAPSPRPRSKH